MRMIDQLMGKKTRNEVDFLAVSSHGRVVEDMIAIVPKGLLLSFSAAK